MDTTVKVEGLVETRRELVRAGGKDMGKSLRQANLSAARRVAAAAVPNVPVRSGRLQRSVRALATQTSGSVKAGTATKVPYAAAIHWGVGDRPGLGPHNIVGRPFLWEAADRMLSEVIEAYDGEIDQLLEAVRS